MRCLIRSNQCQSLCYVIEYFAFHTAALTPNLDPSLLFFKLCELGSRQSELQSWLVSLLSPNLKRIVVDGVAQSSNTALTIGEGVSSDRLVEAVFECFASMGLLVSYSKIINASTLSRQQELRSCHLCSSSDPLL